MINVATYLLCDRLFACFNQGPIAHKGRWHLFGINWFGCRAAEGDPVGHCNHHVAWSPGNHSTPLPLLPPLVPQPFPQVAHPSCHPLPLLPKSLNFLSLTSTFLRDSGNDNWSLVKSCPQYLFLWRIYWQQYEQTFSTMTTFSLSVIGINQLYSGVGEYTPKIETWDDVLYQNPKPPISAWAPFKRLDQLTFVIDVIVTPAVPLHGLDWSDLPRTKVWAGGKIITLLHRSTWLCRVIAILGSLTTTERCFIEGTRDQPLGGADQGNPPPPAIAKPWYYIMSGTISTAFLPEGI